LALSKNFGSRDGEHVVDEESVPFDPLEPLDPLDPLDPLLDPLDPLDPLESLGTVPVVHASRVAIAPVARRNGVRRSVIVSP